jgi:asparagine synthase (glutamine-hydrolysing)
MCGIFSLLNNGDDCKHSVKPVFKKEIVMQAFDKGVKRGPEYSELRQVDLNTSLGFHRLAIIGLDQLSSQPMQIDNITLICNGEIYNYKELYQDIDTDPITKSDCEIIIHLYKRYGIEYTLHLLDGVFAFILYDNDKEKLYVARDPYGVRPLYQLRNRKNNLVWSEGMMINGVWNIGKWEEKPGIAAFASELNVLHHLIAGDSSITIKDNYKISYFPPGSYLLFNKNNDNAWFSDHQPIKYNTFNFSSNIAKSSNLFPVMNDLMYYQNICAYLINAVKKRVVGTCDRPIACLLSGGLDSSLIAALVSKFYQGTLETYSIGMPGSEDLKYAEIVAKHIGSKHTSLVVSEDEFFAAIPEVIGVIESYDTTSVRASVGNYLIGKYIALNSKAKVIFNGDGSDEVTGGYLYFKAAPSPIEFDKECKRLLTDIYAFDVLRSDKSISSNGLEPRTPFLDREFVDYYLSIPAVHRMPKKGEIEKNLLRSAFAKTEPGILPECILWRKKEAFSDGVSSLQKSWYEIIQDKLKSYSCPSNYNINSPKTKEQCYYRDIFEEKYPGQADIVPYFWMPKFIEATDASARTLPGYHAK